MNYHQERLITDKKQLHPWCIIRLHPNLRKVELSGSPKAFSEGRESQLIVRLRRRSDGEAHLQILRANNPTASYEIMFDITSQSSDLTGRQRLLQT